MTRHSLRLTPFALATLLLGGCVMGDDFVRPTAPETPRVAATVLAAETTSTPVKGGEAQRLVDGGVLPAQWWTAFGSDTLNGWVDEALRASPTLDAALATLRQNEALYRAATGDYYPSLTANAGFNRQKISGASVGGGFSGSIFNLYSASVGVRYALDLWGGTRRAVEAQGAAVEAVRQQSQAAYLTLAGNVVTSAVALASAESQLQTRREIVAAYVDTVRLAQRRFEIGAGSRSDVIAYESLAARSAANIPPLEAERDAARNRLAALLGRTPAQMDATTLDLDALTLPTEIPVSLPSTLVRQRPDIAAAEADLAVASANVGVAQANRFPALVLSAQYGSQAAKAGDLFDDNIWNLGANLTAPLFDGGVLSARKQAAVAAYEAAEARYRATVLDAFREVADSLAAVHHNANAVKAAADASRLATENYLLTEKRFAAGAANTFEVRAAKLEAGEARVVLVQALARRHADTAALFTALGGSAPATTDSAGGMPAASAP